MKKHVYLLVILCQIPLFAQSNFWNRDYLLGDLGGGRNSLSDSGIDFELVYTADYINWAGGGVSKGNDYFDNIDLTATFNLEKLIGWEGATFFVYGLGNNGSTIDVSNGYIQGLANKAGAIQGISNINAFNTYKLYQIWLEQKLFNNKLSLLAGLFDLNSEFDVQESSSLFINPSHGIGAEYAQTGENGPSIFPTTSLALRLNYTPTDNLFFMLGVFDGVPGDPDNPNGTRIKFGENDGLLLTYEMGLTENGTELKKGFGRYTIGAWYYTAEFEDIHNIDNVGNPEMRRDNFGAYFSAEKFLFPEKNEQQGMAAFVRAGFANGHINLIDFYWGLGFTYFGLLPGRDEDAFGIAVATSHNGSKFKTLAGDFGYTLSSNEMIIEITYGLQLTPWFLLQPDFQYVINPVAATQNSYATLFGVRTQIVF